MNYQAKQKPPNSLSHLSIFKPWKKNLRFDISKFNDVYPLVLFLFFSSALCYGFSGIQKLQGMKDRKKDNQEEQEWNKESRITILDHLEDNPNSKSISHKFSYDFSLYSRALLY